MVALHDTKITRWSGKDLVKKYERGSMQTGHTPYGCTDSAKTADDLSNVTWKLYENGMKRCTHKSHLPNKLE
jgi:hypothetical protein